MDHHWAIQQRLVGGGLGLFLLFLAWFGAAWIALGDVFLGNGEIWWQIFTDGTLWLVLALDGERSRWWWLITLLDGMFQRVSLCYLTTNGIDPLVWLISFHRTCAIEWWMLILRQRSWWMQFCGLSICSIAFYGIQYKSINFRLSSPPLIWP